MASKYLIDINVCLDALLKRKKFWHDAGLIFQAAEEGNIQAAVSAVSYSTIFYFARSEYGSKDAITRIRAFRELTHISTVDKTIVDGALKSGWKDFEDAVQYYCAIHNDCNGIITRNRKDFKKGNNISILSPAEFISNHL
ncbi:type II toxin-antitoxin system VapC family toxin [Fodinibius halophilus]|uniref:PIN domain-containing protein n=1 Tax=Fodinibius halophilus TaxID=1736908 RepID=A0A6M1T145_9BACT|nr:PIN domain-containing protein [Fodinibius halophilus]NGP87689.1 PIN domain-containing protein [Fodinibius halophilus]